MICEEEKDTREPTVGWATGRAIVPDASRTSTPAAQADIESCSSRDEEGPPRERPSGLLTRLQRLLPGHILAPIIVFWWSPVFLLRPCFEALIGSVAAAIGAFSVGLAVFALRSDQAAAYLSKVPPAAKCFASGVLSGLGLFVMLPSALALQPPGAPVVRLLCTFCAAPVVMYWIHHVILDHQHLPGSSNACGPHAIQVNAKGPNAIITGGTLKFSKMATKCVTVGGAPKCGPCGPGPAAKASCERGHKPSVWEVERQRASARAQWLLEVCMHAPAYAHVCNTAHAARGPNVDERSPCMCMHVHWHTHHA